MTRVYLSGPVEKANEQQMNTWRDVLSTEIEDALDAKILDSAEILDPREFNLELASAGTTLDECLDILESADVVVVRYIEGVETYGTSIEAYVANKDDIPVIAYTSSSVFYEDIPRTLRALADVIVNTTDDVLYHIEALA